MNYCFVVRSRLRMRFGTRRTRPRSVSRLERGHQHLPEKVCHRGPALRRNGTEVEILGKPFFIFMSQARFADKHLFGALLRCEFQET